MLSLSQLTEWLTPFLNSNFVTSLVGAGAGAWAGAYAAQKIAARAGERGELLSEIRNTTAGFNLAVMILNLSLGLKAQHVKALRDTYLQKKTELNEILRQIDARESHPDFVFSADLQGLMPIKTPVEELRNIVFDKIASRRRVVIFMSTLVEAVHSLNEAIADRNRLIDEYRTTEPHSQSELFQFYFAIPDRAAGTVDNRYGAAITAIYTYTDDCIFFAKSIADDLTAHGKDLAKLFKKKFGGEAPSVGVVQIDQDEYLKLLPDPKEYASWDETRFG